MKLILFWKNLKIFKNNLRRKYFKQGKKQENSKKDCMIKYLLWKITVIVYSLS